MHGWFARYGQTGEVGNIRRLTALSKFSQVLRTITIVIAKTISAAFSMHRNE